MKIVILGAGPAGMMAAISAKTHNPNEEVFILDGNQRLGTKLRLTGGGRCNVTAKVSNEEIIKNVPKNGKFLYSSLENFGPSELIDFFNKKGCPLKEEDHHRMFPVSDKSADIVSCLEKEMRDLGVNILLNEKVQDIDFTKKIMFLNEKEFSYDYLIIASGGRTLEGSGSDGSLYPMIESMGHTITELKPAEVPLVSNDQFIQDKTLQGISFQDVVLNIYDNKKLKQSICHDLLFTHFGISGPAALRASYYVLKILEKRETCQIKIDFLKEQSYQELETLLKEKGRNAFLKNIDLPKRLISLIDSNSLNDQELIENIKKFPINIYTTRGFKHAFLTNGGVKVKEINPKTMKSKINTSISFCGEVIDYNAFTGGFNITSALSTGYTAGKYCLTE